MFNLVYLLGDLPFAMLFDCHRQYVQSVKVEKDKVSSLQLLHGHLASLITLNPKQYRGLFSFTPPRHLFFFCVLLQRPTFHLFLSTLWTRKMNGMFFFISHFWSLKLRKKCVSDLRPFACVKVSLFTLPVHMQFGISCMTRKTVAWVVCHGCPFILPPMSRPPANRLTILRASMEYVVPG